MADAPEGDKIYGAFGCETGAGGITPERSNPVQRKESRNG